MLTMREHQKHATWRSCPICFKAYDTHWKVWAHIRKACDNLHCNFANQQIEEAILIYNKCTRQSFHDALASRGNIFAGLAFKSFCIIINQIYSPEEMEHIRRRRISETMHLCPKSDQHNQKVAQGVRRAWTEGKYDTIECVEARRKGYAGRRSFAGENNPMYGRPAPSGSGYGKSGFREDLGLFFRSTWEANFARFLKKKNIVFLYEKSVFCFEYNGHKLTYRPDFYLPHKKIFYEIKGHARSRSHWMCQCPNCRKTRIAVAAMRQLGNRIKIVGKKEYNRIVGPYLSEPFFEK